MRYKNTVASDSNNMYRDYLEGRFPSIQPPDSSPLYQSSPLSETIASSRCEIPGSLCGSAGDTAFHSHKPKLDQQNMPSTPQLINAIMNAPGFPQLAARLMSEEPSFLSRDIGKQVTRERQLGEFPIDPNSNMESTDPASARFLMEQTVAKENPGDSFIRNDPNFSVLDIHGLIQTSKRKIILIKLVMKMQYSMPKMLLQMIPQTHQETLIMTVMKVRRQ